MTVVSKPVSVGKLRAFLLFGEVPLFLRQLFSQKNLVHALAGALGGISSLSIFFPLDTAKTRLQIDDERKAKTTWKVIYEIVHEEGLSSLYRGLLPVLSSLYCSNFVYFYTFNGLKAAYVTKRSPETVVVDLLCGFLAGVINVLITTPLWVANTRMKLQGVNLKSEELSRKVQYKYTGLIDAVHQIYRTEGLRGLWSGTRASLVLTSNPAIQFTVYETIKRYVRGAGKDTGYWKDESKKPNFVVIMAQILRQGGVKGLYKGLEAKLLQTVLTAAFMFLAYENILTFAFSLLGVQKQRKT
ncbi:peroxisomal membrane protein PMP34-like isoform X3 [Xenia sp. Carnegie-2017]|uniref:peroxisomal membrane protein PMP34-like isoform X3 n=1 Tax=Xenia sp. Carnegie-2017 TaxID=2897299 RepID=UPI001F043FE0|nr:peroxisomal membrane protein PMP34-like isoform X3 [Xenia sp. Carnegie-2017]